MRVEFLQEMIRMQGSKRSSPETSPGKRRILALAGVNRRLFFGPLALGLILILALYLRCYHLGSRPLFGDEPFFTVEIATRSLGQITTTNLGSTLYPLLVHFLLPLGKTETMARLLAALFGFFSVSAVFLLAKKIFGKKEALIAALFSSVSTYEIFFSQQARGYTGMLLCSILSLYFFWRALDESRPHFWILYALSTVVGIYFHLILILVIPVQAVFVIIWLLYRWAQKRKRGERAFSPKIFWGAALSLFFILVLTYLLNLPVSKSPSQHTLFFYLNKGISNILTIDTFRDPLQLMSMVMKRFLAYERWAFFFFVQFALFLFGLVSCLRRNRKFLVLFVLYWTLTFLGFIMSNPSGVYFTPPNANKFMMLLPLVFILMARGLSEVASFLGRAVSQLARVQPSSTLPKAIWVVLILGLLLGEGIVLETYNVQLWQFFGLERDREINRCLETQVSGREMVYFSDAPNRNDFLFIQPLYPSDSGPKTFMLFEDHVDFFIKQDLLRQVGLFVVLNRSRWQDYDRSRLKELLPMESIQELSEYLVVHFPKDGRTLYDKLVPAINLTANFPGTDDGPKRESHLLLAKVHLLAQKTDEALRELDRFERLNSSLLAPTKNESGSGFLKSYILRPLSRDKETPSTRLQGLLKQKIEASLVESAERASFEGRVDDAISLQKRAEPLITRQPRTAFRFHLSLAELYSRKGMKNEADGEFLEALISRRTPREEINVLNRLKKLHALPGGFLVWITDGTCHLRWWSDETRTYTGTITSVPPIRKVKAFRLEADDKFRRFDNTIKFIGIARTDWIEGIDLMGQTQAQLSFFLKIDGRENIEKNVIILPGGIHPPGMPFDLGVRRQ